MLNMLPIVFEHIFRPCIVTDIGDSPSALRLISRMGKDCFPSLDQPHKRPAPWHVAVARHMMARHRRDFGTSSTAVLDESTFVVRGSNDPRGGGAHALISVSNTRRSRDLAANAFFEQRMDPANGDEMFLVTKFTLVDYLTGAAVAASR